MLVLIIMTKYVHMNRASNAFISKQYLLIKMEHLDEQLLVRFLEKVSFWSDEIFIASAFSEGPHEIMQK